MADKVPKFCSVCGQKLVSSSKTLQGGFDPFTGKANPTTVPMLVCPERGDAVNNEHDRWELNPANPTPGVWERWDG